MPSESKKLAHAREYYGKGDIIVDMDMMPRMNSGSVSRIIMYGPEDFWEDPQGNIYASRYGTRPAVKLYDSASRDWARRTQRSMGSVKRTLSRIGHVSFN